MCPWNAVYSDKLHSTWEKLCPPSGNPADRSDSENTYNPAAGPSRLHITRALTGPIVVVERVTVTGQLGLIAWRPPRERRALLAVLELTVLHAPKTRLMVASLSM